MGLPGLLIDIVGSGPMSTLDTARQMSLMIDGVGCSRRGRGPMDINKVPFPKQKNQ